MEGKQFNIRVYAIIWDEKREYILLSDEFIKGNNITKFPGGGLDWGEGTIDCLKREALEEFGQAIEVMDHFYTTDFFQKAFFFENQQLISIYYTAKFAEKPEFTVSFNTCYKVPLVEGDEAFWWCPVNRITDDIFTLPVDKKVASMLKSKFVNGE